MPAIAPTIHCVVLTGIPMYDAVATISEEASDAEEPRVGDNAVSLRRRILLSV